MTGKRGRPQLIHVDDYKDEIIRLYREDGVQINDIAEQINAKYGIDVSVRTLTRRLQGWSVPHKRVRMEAPEDLIERIRFHYNRNLTDKQIEEALVQEGFEIPRNLPRLRQRLGMRRRSRFDQFRDFSPGEDPVLKKPVRIYRKQLGPLPPPSGLAPSQSSEPTGPKTTTSTTAQTSPLAEAITQATSSTIEEAEGGLNNMDTHPESDEEDEGPAYHSAPPRSPSPSRSASTSQPPISRPIPSAISPTPPVAQLTSISPPRATPVRRAVKKAKGKPNPTLIPKVTAFVQKYMSAYDGSHDFNHIRRVVGLAHAIYTSVMEEAESENAPPEFDLDLQVITLAALLHDVGDKKYVKPGEDPNSVVLAKLLELGADEELAIKVQRIVSGVSYSSEIKDPNAVITMIGKYPELAVVQDADRLDAIGAVGIGRTFAFGGAKGRGMGDTIEHFGEKLEKLEGMMKTRPGKRMAVERTKRLLAFREWWEEELREAEGTLKPPQKGYTAAENASNGDI
ncbi:hypothetical protein B7463_g7805, partial [Scytalidium lignicola]